MQIQSKQLITTTFKKKNQKKDIILKDQMQKCTIINKENEKNEKKNKTQPNWTKL